MKTLQHWGVLGMKWGRRKARASSDSSDHSTARSLGKKKLNELSNDELKKLTARLQLEKQYKDLTRKEIGAGQKFATEIVTGVAKQAATKYISENLPKAASFLAEQFKNRG